MKVKYAFVFLFFACGFFKADGADAIKPLLEQIPQNSLEIVSFVEKTCCTWEQEIQTFSNACKQREPLHSIVGKWKNIGSDYLAKVALLTMIRGCVPDPEVIQAAQESAGKLHYFLMNALATHQTSETLLAYLQHARKAGELNGDSCDFLVSFLKDYEGLKPELKQQFLELVGSFDLTKPAYKLVQGITPTKKAGTEFSLLCWNICGPPQALPLIAGGVLPLKMRLKGIADKILNTDPDVICLQELFDVDAAWKLQDLLKGRYAHFCLAISPPHFGFTPASVSLGSGFFVASKYPLEKCEWTPFQNNPISAIERGFFSFDISNGKESVRIFNTHLESCLDDPTLPCSSRESRFAQLKEILTYVEKQVGTARQFSKTFLLCGDLNVYWGLGEPSEGLMKECFYDGYNAGRKECTLNDCTHCDLTGYWWPRYAMNLKTGSYKPQPWILDYVLLLSKLPNGATFTKNCAMQTKRISVGGPESPATTLSDHHALLSTCSWR